MRRVLGWCFLVVLLLLFVDATLMQVQLATVGYVVVTTYVFKITLMVLISLNGALALVRDGDALVQVPRPVWGTLGAFVLLLVLELWRGSYTSSVSYMVFGINANYFFFLVGIPVVLMRVHPQTATWALVIVGVPLSGLGIAQYLLNDPIVFEGMEDLGFAVVAADFFGAQRAYSLFSTALNFGHFLAFLGGLLIHRVARSTGWGRGVWLVLLATVLLAAVGTLTRAIYLEVMMVVASSVILVRADRSRILSLGSWLMLGYAGVGLAVVLAGAMFGSSGSGIFTNQTLLMRLDEWSHFVALWFSGGIGDVLLGMGTLQSIRFLSSADVLIDNSFVAIGAHSGLLGLLLWIAVMTAWWRWMCERFAAGGDNPVLFAVLVIWTTWLPSASLGITQWLYPMLAVLGLATVTICPPDDASALEASWES